MPQSLIASQKGAEGHNSAHPVVWTGAFEHSHCLAEASTLLKLNSHSLNAGCDECLESLVGSLRSFSDSLSHQQYVLWLRDLWQVINAKCPTS